jgi:hypothetical protein
MNIHVLEESKSSQNKSPKIEKETDINVNKTTQQKVEGKIVCIIEYSIDENKNPFVVNKTYYDENGNKIESKELNEIKKMI